MPDNEVSSDTVVIVMMMVLMVASLFLVLEFNSNCSNGIDQWQCFGNSGDSVNSAACLHTFNLSVCFFFFVCVCATIHNLLQMTKLSSNTQQTAY